MRLVASLAILLLVSVASATGLQPSGFSLVEPSGDGWFNPEFSGTAGLSFVTGGGRTLGSGTYVGTMSLSLHPTLRTSVDLGYTRLYDFHGFSSGRILGGLDVEWKPSDDFVLLFHCSGSLPDSSITGL